MTQQQNFYTDEVKSVWNPVINADWTMELLCCFSYYLRTKKHKHNESMTKQSILQASNLPATPAASFATSWLMKAMLGGVLASSLPKLQFFSHFDCYHFHGPR